MSNGLLISGTRKLFETTFGVDLANVELPFQLPIPPICRDYVASIGIPRPRVPYGVHS
jgi:hypothetical protein